MTVAASKYWINLITKTLTTTHTHHTHTHSQPGEFSVADPEVDAQILPTKLRIDYPYVVLDPDKVEEMGDSRPSWTVANWEVDSKGRDKLTVKDAVKGPSADIPKVSSKEGCCVWRPSILLLVLFYCTIYDIMYAILTNQQCFVPLFFSYITL